MPFLIALLLSVFTWNAFSAEKLAIDTKIVLPKKSLIKIASGSDFHSCQIENNDMPSNTDHPWSIVANGASREKRTLTLFNSQSHKVVMMNCYKSVSEAGEKTSPLTDLQIIELLKASQAQII